MPPLLEQLTRGDRRVVRAHRRRELAVRTDDDHRGPARRRRHSSRARADAAISISRSFPPRRINDNGVFLDDQPFIALREELEMPVYPSYDFVDVLVHEGEPHAAGVAA